MSSAGARLALASQSPTSYGGRIIDVGNGAFIVQNTVPPYTFCNPQKNFAAFGRIVQVNTSEPNSFWMTNEQKAAPSQYVVGKQGYFVDAFGSAYTR